MVRTFIALCLVALLPARIPAAEICLGPSTIDPNQANVSVTCDTYELVENTWVGFTTSGMPCESYDPVCQVVSYGWTISASEIDPSVNSGPLDPIDQLYLWLACSQGIDPPGASAAAFDLLPVGMAVIAYTPINDYFNVGTPTQLALALPGCPTPPTAIGVITVSTQPISVEGSSWGSVKALYR